MRQARVLAPIRRLSPAARRRAAAAQVFDLADLKPLPTWFFAFEGVIGAAFDIIKIDPNLIAVLIGLGALNALVSMTVLRRRIKMARAMLRNKRTRSIALALVGLRIGVHLVLNVLGAAITGPVGHGLVAVLMAGTTVALLAFDQKVTLRVLTAAAADAGPARLTVSVPVENLAPAPVRIPELARA
jgi:hypothetical protein